MHLLAETKRNKAFPFQKPEAYVVMWQNMRLKAMEEV